MAALDGVRAVERVRIGSCAGAAGLDSCAECRHPWIQLPWLWLQQAVPPGAVPATMTIAR